MSEPKVKLLLVDDEALVRDELGGILRDEGYEVITGSDGEEGLDLFRTLHPEMVITDIRMPRRDGLSVAITIRQEAPHVPVTVITGHGTEAMAIEALRAGVTDFIKKPVRMEDLSGALSRMEAGRRQLLAVEHAGLPAAVRVLQRSWKYRLGNELEVVPQFVDGLLANCGTGDDRQAVMELSLALRELVINAVEHGNLGLNFEQKTAALEDGTLVKLLERLALVPANARRRVTVEATLRDRELTVRIADMGQGFNWRDLADPHDPANLLSLHGRGVLLARMSVDSLTYSHKGNVVTVVKAL